MKELSTGASAATLFRSLRNRPVAPGPMDLFDLLAMSFPGICPEAALAISHWYEVPNGTWRDRHLDAVIRHHLEDAGYLEEPYSPLGAIDILLRDHDDADPSEREDAVFLLRRIVSCLNVDFGHPVKDAVELVNRYCEKFCDEHFCSAFNITPETIEYFFHEEELAMAGRVQYYVVLSHKPDKQAFIAWFNPVVVALRGR